LSVVSCQRSLIIGHLFLVIRSSLLTAMLRGWGSFLG
jgi:hypothetical protein